MKSLAHHSTFNEEEEEEGEELKMEIGSLFGVQHVAHVVLWMASAAA